MKPLKDRRIWIGLSGYNYKHWSGIFYPKDLPANRWFDFYIKRFPTLELNFSFYRLPLKSSYEEWYRRSPPDYPIFIKGSRFITQMKKMKDCRDALELFFSRAEALKEKLAGVLWQFPPRFKKNAERLSVFLEDLRGFPAPRHCFEFRDASWFDDEVAGILAKHGAAFCRADQRDYYNYVTIPDTSDFIYIRRHGITVSTSYSDEAIQKDAKEILSWSGKKKDVFVYYNNDIGGAALYDAIRLEAALFGNKKRLGSFEEVLQNARAA